MKKTILLFSLLPLAACTPTYEDLTQWMTETRQEAKRNILPFEPPTVTPPKLYIPPVQSGLNAFDSRRLETIQRGSNAPNPNRPKEVLEGFSLENLQYVGTLKGQGRTKAFIRADNHVYTVYVGNYIGQNHGRIQSIAEDKIILTELVEDSYGNWIYRKTELPLNSKTDSGNNTPAAASNNNGTQPTVELK